MDTAAEKQSVCIGMLNQENQRNYRNFYRNTSPSVNSIKTGVKRS